MSLKDDMKLDILDLDTAALTQADLYYTIGQQWAEAVAERDSLKEKLASARATADEEIRKNPKKFNAEDMKITEAWVAAKISLHPEVVSISAKLIDAQLNVNILAIGKEALDHRLKMISVLMELYKGNYYIASSRTHSPHELAIDSSHEKQREIIEQHPRMLKRINKNGNT